MTFKCNHCNKEYKSQSSRCNHIKKFHTNNNEDENNKSEKNFICDKCHKGFNNLDDIKDHSENDCRPSVKSNNIYKFKSETFGINKYKNFKGGDIYIVQTEFSLKGYYKIGISTNLSQRLGQYRCGNVLEPKLHYYYPCKNIKETDKLLKEKLKNFNVKREIYKADNINDLRNAIKQVQKESKSSELEIIPEIINCKITGCSSCNLFFTNKEDLETHIKNNHYMYNFFKIISENYKIDHENYNLKIKNLESKKENLEIKNKLNHFKLLGNIFQFIETNDDLIIDNNLLNIVHKLILVFRLFIDKFLNEDDFFSIIEENFEKLTCIYNK